MGTRGLVGFIDNKKLKVCYYNHYDSYITGLGMSVIKFLNNINKENLHSLLSSSEIKFKEDFNDKDNQNSPYRYGYHIFDYLTKCLKNQTTQINTNEESLKNTQEFNYIYNFSTKKLKIIFYNNSATIEPTSTNMMALDLLFSSCEDALDTDNYKHFLQSLKKYNLNENCVLDACFDLLNSKSLKIDKDEKKLWKKQDFYKKRKLLKKLELV